MNNRSTLSTIIRGAHGLVALMAAASPAAAAPPSPFATRVLDYSPAPGQRVNDPSFNDPTRALGAPVGGGPYSPNNTKVVTLGGFGGSITLGFDHRILDRRHAAGGLDFIVFGNAFWAGGNPNRRYAEGAIIEISLDANGNGLADDPWFLVPGSHVPSPSTAWYTQIWDDNLADPAYPPYVAGWVPFGRSGTWSTSGYKLPNPPFGASAVLTNPNGLGATVEGVWGYADLSPTLPLGDLDGDGIPDDPDMEPEDFFTRPDDPRAVGITPGSCGGDAFDIGWTINPLTGLPANLPGFDFIRITTAVNAADPVLGEISAEISGVAEVRPRATTNDGSPFLRGARRHRRRWSRTHGRVVRMRPSR
ncbi:MAG: hypothetical protein JNM07_00105 [Phycisphaerae bacterium]|nr:hypothetical protein [Phycisphaerae bacterium]